MIMRIANETFVIPLAGGMSLAASGLLGLIMMSINKEMVKGIKNNAAKHVDEIRSDMGEQTESVLQSYREQTEAILQSNREQTEAIATRALNPHTGNK